MSEVPEITDATCVHQLLEMCRYRLLVHSVQILPDIKAPEFIFDTPTIDEPPTKDLLIEVHKAVDAGGTVLLSFADEKRREYVHVVARSVGWKSIKMEVSSPDTKF